MFLSVNTLTQRLTSVKKTTRAEVFYNERVKHILLKLLLIFLTALYGWFSIVDIQTTALLRQANLLLTSRYPAEAEALYRQAVQNEPWRKPDWNGVAAQFLTRRESDRAVKLLVSLAEENYLSSDGWLSLADAYAMNRQSEKVEPALFHARSLAKNKDEISSALQAQIRYYRSQGDFKAALTCQRELTVLSDLNRESKIDEILLLGLFDRETTLNEWQQMDSKPDWFEQWGSAFRNASNTPDDAQRWLSIGRAYGAAGVWDLSEYSFSQTVMYSPEYAEAWALLAEALQQQGKNGGEQINKALQLAPLSPAVRLTAALYYRRQLNFNRSIEMLDANIQESPDEPLWFLELGRTLAKAGRFEDALVAYQQAARKDPKGVANRLALVRFCVQYDYRLKDIGLPTALQAEKLDPESTEVLDVLGQVYFSLGDYTSAREAFERVLNRNAEFVPVWLHIAQMSLADGDSLRAKDALAKAISLGGDTTEGRLAARLMLQYFPGYSTPLKGGG